MIVNIGETRDALQAALEILERHPPIEVRGDDRPHSGQHDCDVCKYPLTGCVAPNMPKHEDYRKKSWNGDPGERCDYIVAMEKTRKAIVAIDKALEDEEQDIVTAIGEICLACGKTG